MAEPFVILGSHRNPSHTQQFLEALFVGQRLTLVNLLEIEIVPYGYAAVYPVQDEFFRVVDQLLAHDRIVFATPVYWYAMSGRMKNFFDRLTDLVTTHKDLGRQLRGKTMFLLAVGADAAMPEGFLVPFASTAAYLGMRFGGSIYVSSEQPSFPRPFTEEMRRFQLAAIE